VGPLSTPDGVADLDRDVRKSVEAGAKILTGGKPLDRPGNFYAPTVLVNIPKDSPAYKEEMFGPVASVFRAKDVNEAIRIANDSRFGLGASAWTNDAAEQRNSSMSWTPGWCSSTGWWLPIRGYLSEGSSGRATDGSWEPWESGSSQISRRCGWSKGKSRGRKSSGEERVAEEGREW